MIEKNSIINADCLVAMKDIPDWSVDAVITDLPFGSTRNPWDIVIPFDKLWEQWNRIAKDNAPFILFAQGIFYVDLVQSNRENFRYDLVWEKVLKSGFLNANVMPLRMHEQIAVFYRKKPTYNPQMEEGQPLHGKGTAIFEKDDFINNCYGDFKPASDERKGSTEKYPSSIVRFQKPHPSSSVHPTQKSVELLQYLIRTYTNEGETVLDSCCGSGTTAIAAIREKRNWICIEKSEEYYNIAKKRIENELNQPTLF